MSALFRIVYAAHANGTHHKLALDALRRMERRDAEDWTRVFLKHVVLYLEGSKAPDVSFKDFKNHVLHVADDYWGGAPEKVEAWYSHLVGALREAKWEDAAYAAGVLSHYYTDPVHPFHTGQTEAENAVHRAVEWSINRSYDRLRAIADARFSDMNVSMAEGDRWLREAVCDGAEFSHRYYEKLLTHYDIHRGVVRPEEGLDEVSEVVVAELISYAAIGFARILDRAIAESGATPPPVSLTIDTVLAAARIPRKWIEKRLANAEDRKLVQAMYDELIETGKVEHTLPEDDRVIRDLYAREVLEPKLAKRDSVRATRVPAGDPALRRQQEEIKIASQRPVAPAALAGDTALARAVAKSAITISEPTIRPPALPQTSQMQPVRPVAPATAVPIVPAARQATPIDAPSQTGDRKRYLSEEDDLEAAPSIGPKTAERFAALGIMTVKDFLGHAPHDMAELLDDDRIDAETLTDWQDQAQLVIEVPGLRGTHAQLLVGAGYRTAQAIADAEPVTLSADVLRFAATSDGKRVLREGHPPDLEKIKSWVVAANEALAA